MSIGAGARLARVSLPFISGLPEDVCVNDFAFNWTAAGPFSGDHDQLVDNVVEFYNETPGGPTSISDFISSVIDRTANVCRVDLYAIPGASGPLGSPVHSATFTLGPANAGAVLPEEVAICASFNADLTGVLEESGATRPRARRRGRLFIGPLIASAFETGTNGVLVSPAASGIIVQSMIDLEAKNSPLGWEWVVFSRADWDVRNVVGGFVDNAPDTQRRRGPKSTARETWAA